MYKNKIILCFQTKFDCQEEPQLLHRLLGWGFDLLLHEETIKKVIKFNCLHICILIDIFGLDVFFKDLFKICLFTTFGLIERLLDLKKEFKCGLCQNPVIKPKPLRLLKNFLFVEIIFYKCVNILVEYKTLFLTILELLHAAFLKNVIVGFLLSHKNMKETIELFLWKLYLHLVD